MADELCCCGRLDARGKAMPWAACCSPYLEGRALPPDAETLMRSRYSAFVREQADYLLTSWHPDTRPPELAFEPGVKWLGLQVRSHRQTDPTHAEVEFVARSRVAGRGHRLHERSRFLYENGRWYYVDGDLY